MKILIIGTIASGKTTLAKKLEQKLNIKYYELDSIVHDDENQVRRTPNEQKEIIQEIDKQKEWIIEGVLRENLNYLLDMCDKIIYLNMPLYIRKIRIFKRFVKQKLGIEKSNYKPTLKMLIQMYKWTTKQENELKERENLLIKYSNKLFKINNTKEWEEYIKNEYCKT